MPRRGAGTLCFDEIDSHGASRDPTLTGHRMQTQCRTR
jgi:hypothetical protein